RGQRRVGGGDQESGQQQQAPSPDDGVDPARGYGHQQEQTEDLKVHVSVDEGRGRTDHEVFWCGRKDVGASFVHLLVRLCISCAFTLYIDSVVPGDRTRAPVHHHLPWATPIPTRTPLSIPRPGRSARQGSDVPPRARGAPDPLPGS